MKPIYAPFSVTVNSLEGPVGQINYSVNLSNILYIIGLTDTCTLVFPGNSQLTVNGIFDKVIALIANAIGVA